MEDIALKWEKLKKGYFGIVFHFMEAEHINLQWGPDPTGQWSSIVFSSAVLRWEFIKEHKKERKKERKHAVDQEPTKKSIKKKRKFFIFSWSLSWSRACCLSFFLDRYRFSFFWSLSWSRACFLSFFLIAYLVESVFSCFLTFFSFINSHLWPRDLALGTDTLKGLRIAKMKMKILSCFNKYPWKQNKKLFLQFFQVLLVEINAGTVASTLFPFPFLFQFPFSSLSFPLSLLDFL